MNNWKWVVAASLLAAARAWSFESVDFGKVMPGRQGSTVYDEVTDTYTLIGTGYDLWGNGDSGGRFMFLPMAGDCEVIATVQRPTAAGLNNWTRTGLGIFPEVLDDTVNLTFSRVKEAATGTEATGNTQRVIIDTRDVKDGVTSRRKDIAADPLFSDAWLGMRIVRRGDTNTCYYTNSTVSSWTLLHTQTLAIGERVNAGVQTCRHKSSDRTAVPQMTNDFRGVIVRELVTSRPSGIDKMIVSWVSDLAEMPAAPFTYRLERSTNRTNGFAQVASGLTANVYTNTGLAANSSFCYRVYAVPDSGSDFLIGTGPILRTPYATAGSFTRPADAVEGVYTEIYSPAGAKDPLAVSYRPIVSNVWDGVSGLNMNSLTARVWANLVPETADVYTLIADTGYSVSVWLDDALVITSPYETGDSGDNLHATVGSAVSQPLWLESGRPYRLRVEYTQTAATADGPKCVLRWIRQGDPVARVIPTSVFWSVPQPWSHLFVGTPQVNGGATFAPAAGRFTVAGGGGDIWSTSDAHRFVYREMTNNFEFIARIASQSGNSTWKKAGLMARKSVSASDAYYGAFQTPAGQASTQRWLVTQWRTTSGGGSLNRSSQVTTDPDFPQVPSGDYLWVLLTRNGDVLRTYAKNTPDGVWKLFEERTDIILGDVAEVGLAVTSHDAATLSLTEFDNVTLVERPTGTLTAATNSSGQAELSVAVEATSDRQQRLAASSAQMSGLWTNALGTGVASFDVLRAAGSTSVYAKIGELTAAQALSGTFADTGYTPDPYTLTYYRLACRYPTGDVEAPADSNRIYFTSVPLGVLQPARTFAPDPAGTGLYFEYVSNTVSGSYADMPPSFAQVDNIARYLDNNAAGLLPAGSGLSNTLYTVTMSGWIVPPITATYQLRTRGDDGYYIWINGVRVAAQSSYMVNAYFYSSPFDLKAGEPVSIHVMMFQGSGGANLDITYKHDGMSDWSYIPTANQFPLTAYTLAQSQARLSSPVMRTPWQSQTITDLSRNSGHVAVNADATAFKLSGPGYDIGGTNDGFHFVFKRTKYSFDLSAKLTALQTVDLSNSKCGLMIRNGAETNAWNVALLRPYPTAPVFQKRDGTTGGGTTGLATAPDSAWPTVLRLSYNRHTRTVTAYVNGTLLGSTVLQGEWNQEVMAGLAVTSRNTAFYADAVFEEVAMDINYPKGVIILMQ